jgi:hypothetical protein
MHLFAVKPPSVSHIMGTNDIGHDHFAVLFPWLFLGLLCAVGICLSYGAIRLYRRTGVARRERTLETVEDNP